MHGPVNVRFFWEVLRRVVWQIVISFSKNRVRLYHIGIKLFRRLTAKL
jgi:hypothetical protein